MKYCDKNNSFLKSKNWQKMIYFKKTRKMY